MLDPASLRRLQPQLFRLRGIRCTDCGFMAIGTRPTCPKCSASQVREDFFQPSGRLLEVTCVTRPVPDYSRQQPHWLGLIELDEGPRLIASVTDVVNGEISAGVRGSLVTRRLFEPRRDEIICYGYKFSPHRE